jgi:hypothetical protein
LQKLQNTGLQNTYLVILLHFLDEVRDYTTVHLARPSLIEHDDVVAKWLLSPEGWIIDAFGQIHRNEYRRPLVLQSLLPGRSVKGECIINEVLQNNIVNFVRTSKQIPEIELAKADGSMSSPRNLVLATCKASSRLRQRT